MKERYKTDYERYCEQQDSKRFCITMIVCAVVLPFVVLALGAIGII